MQIRSFITLGTLVRRTTAAFALPLPHPPTDIIRLILTLYACWNIFNGKFNTGEYTATAVRVQSDLIAARAIRVTIFHLLLLLLLTN